MCEKQLIRIWVLIQLPAKQMYWVFLVLSCLCLSSQDFHTFLDACLMAVSYVEDVTSFFCSRFLDWHLSKRVSLDSKLHEVEIRSAKVTMRPKKVMEDLLYRICNGLKVERRQMPLQQTSLCFHWSFSSSTLEIPIEISWSLGVRIHGDRSTVDHQVIIATILNVTLILLN